MGHLLTVKFSGTHGTICSVIYVYSNICQNSRRAHNVVVTANGVFAVGGIGALPGDMSMKPVTHQNTHLRGIIISSIYSQ